MLSLPSMSRGYAYVNGFNLGRYWTIASEIPTTNRTCGPLSFSPQESPAPVQIEYHIPPDVLLFEESNLTNLLTLFDELGGDVSQIELVMYDDPIYEVQ
jgi:hypothetical protein